MSSKEKVKSLLSAMCVCLLLVCFWTFCMSITYMFIQGADPYFPLDANYAMVNWPGRIFENFSEHDNLRKPELDNIININAIAVLHGFIVGRTQKSEWFAIDRHTHQIWFPYSSPQQLQEIAHIQFSESQLYTSFPWKLWVGYEHIKVPFFIYIAFCAVTLIGFVIWGVARAVR